jgi:ketosteroid isomerase-like protein
MIWLMSESTVEMARRGYDAALRGDLDVIGAMLDPEVKWHGGDPSSPDGCHNRTEALAFMRHAFATGAIGELVDVVGADDKVVVIMRPLSQGEQPAALRANLTTFRDGKVVEMVHYPDPDDALAAARA